MSEFYMQIVTWKKPKQNPPGARSCDCRAFLLGAATWLMVTGAAWAQSDSPDPTAPMLGAAALPRDLTPWGMFMSAHPVVKCVIVGLALASIVTWTIWLAKTIELLGAKR
jgi:hypothetical protein